MVETFREPEQVKRIRYAIANSPVTGISFNQIMKQEGISNRTLKAIEASMKNGDPIPEARPKMEHWRMHDIRRTARTGMAIAGVPDKIGELLVGHSLEVEDGRPMPKIMKVYNQYDQWPAKMDGVKKWEERLLAVIDGTAPSILESRFGITSPTTQLELSP